MTVSFGKIKEFFRNKTVRIICLCLMALLLLLASFSVFAGEKEESGYVPTALEARIVDLLVKIEGVDSATVMISEEGGRAVSAVIIFEGEDGILLRNSIL